MSRVLKCGDDIGTPAPVRDYCQDSRAWSRVWRPEARPEGRESAGMPGGAALRRMAGDPA